MSEQKIVGTFTIPDDLARELSDLLTKQTIRERLLMQLINDPAKYEQAEALLVPITAKIEAIKVKITNEYVPAHFGFSKYIWNYDGYEVSGCEVDVLQIAE
jgi:hypothetical protein